MKYRTRLPQLDGGLFLTDGGLETDLIFNHGFDLPYFAAFTLVNDDKGRKALRDYYTRFADVAKRDGAGFVLESPTWRASVDWAQKLDYSDQSLADTIKASVAMLEELRTAYETETAPVVISGCVGPRGDGYDPGNAMSSDEAQAYHAQQIGTFAETAADMVTAITMTNTPEAIGLTRAAKAAGLPVCIAFTVETDGRLPTEQPLGEAVQEVDAATDTGPAYYMINCAHPTHFEAVLESGEPWLQRVRAIRANASRRSHEELDEAPDLDDGDPVELGGQYRDLRAKHAQINVLGGCCGTDHRHIDHISRACLAA